MANSQHLQLDVVTPAGSVLSVEVDSVQAPSVEGEFGVLPNHLPLKFCNFNNAFLQGDLPMLLYLQVPQPFCTMPEYKDKCFCCTHSRYSDCRAI